MKIRLLRKDIFEISADVCVSTVHHSKDLGIGHLSRLILREGGQEVQDDLKAAHSEGHLTQGEIVAIESGKLQRKFKHLFFACLFDWNTTNAEEIKEIVGTCCLLASGNNLKSLVFPCLGTGGLGFPEKVSSQAMMEGLALFAGTFGNTQSSLETVYISLYGKSPPCVMKWEDVFQTMVGQYNELAAQGWSQPIHYVAETGSSSPKETRHPQNTASASSPKGRQHKAARGRSDISSLVPITASNANTQSGWWSLPSWLSFGSTVGPVQVSATPGLRGRLQSDGGEIDLSLKVKVTSPYLKTIFGNLWATNNS